MYKCVRPNRHQGILTIFDSGWEKIVLIYNPYCIVIYQKHDLSHIRFLGFCSQQDQFLGHWLLVKGVDIMCAFIELCCCFSCCVSERKFCYDFHPFTERF